MGHVNIFILLLILILLSNAFWFGVKLFTSPAVNDMPAFGLAGYASKYKVLGIGITYGYF
jgi:hypothetical protein